MPDPFDRLIDPLIGREGGYVNHTSDRGGETIWGITIATARRYGYSGPMRDMPRGEAVRIYRERYWREPGFHDVAARSVAVAEELFDTGVNMGQAVAGIFLQRLLNGLNRQGKDYPDIKVDGDIGRSLSLVGHHRYRGAPRAARPDTGAAPSPRCRRHHHAGARPGGRVHRLAGRRAPGMG